MAAVLVLISGTATAHAADREACKPVKALTEETQPSSGSVIKTLPAPPPGADRWRVTFGTNLNGFVVRLFVGDEQLGSGLIRWDRSYRFTLALHDPVDLSGRLEGCDLFAKDPMTKVTGSVGGPIALTDGISLSGAGVVWDAAGLRLRGDARIGCATGGALKGAGAVDYAGAGDWRLDVLGSSDGPPCVMEDGMEIGDATIGGTITSVAGLVDGKVTGYARVAAPDLPFGPWEATFALLIGGPNPGFSADAKSAAGFAKVTIGADGKLVITLNLLGGETTAEQPAPDTGGDYVDPASLLPPSVKTPARAKRRCVVPKVKRGATLTSVRRSFSKANCRVRAKRVRSAKVRRGRVIGTSRKTGTKLAAGTKVTVTVSLGGRRR
ncbi:MAG: PASTA domain-containing protein [Solirubrobacteraceae bacterium]|nr:PASTA domain-containing protein [Solirubrobacteraceae bacterium]